MEEYDEPRDAEAPTRTPWYEFDPRTGISVMIVLTGCLAVLFSKELNIGELPEWFQSAFLMAVGFYLAARTLQEVKK